MIVMRHHPSAGRWEFSAIQGDLSGGGKTLAQCKDAAEHAARAYFTRGSWVVAERVFKADSFLLLQRVPG